MCAFCAASIVIWAGTMSLGGALIYLERAYVVRAAAARRERARPKPRPGWTRSAEKLVFAVAFLVTVAFFACHQSEIVLGSDACVAEAR